MTAFSPHNDIDTPVWGAGEIGKIINRDKRQTYWLLESGKLDATKVGATWTSTKRRLSRSLGLEAA